MGIERVNRVKMLLRTFLKWEQNSVLTGNLTDSQFRELKDRLAKIVNKEKDHIMIMEIRTEKYVNRIDLGTPKSNLDEGDMFI